MIWTIEFHQPLNLVKVICEEKSSVEDALLAKKEYLSSPYWQPGMNILVDLRRTILIYPGLDQLRRTVTFNVKHKEEYGAGRIAYLVKDGRDYGIARQITSLLKMHTDSEADSYLSEKASMEWLTAAVLEERSPLIK